MFTRSDDQPLELRPTPTEALWTATERLRALEDSTPVAIIGLDLQRRVTIWNRAAERLFGGSAKELIGRAFTLFRDEHQSEYVALLARALQGETIASIETCRLTQEGAPITVCFSSAPVWDATGQLAGTIITLNDLTQLKRVEDQFLQSQKMEVVGQLAGGIAHDFNNLLTAILGFGDLVLERVSDRPDVAADVEEIRRAGERATQLTRQLLAFSRKQLWIPQVLDLKVVVQAFERMLTRMISEDIRLIVVASRAVAHTRADPAQVEQVLMNLVVNARDAMPQGGALTIATADVVLDTAFCRDHAGATPGAYVAVTVTDTGCGMTPAIVARLFEPFFTTKASGQGTGLGMSTVQRIMHHCGGHVAVDTEPGRGTAVTAYWPTVDATAAVDAVTTVARPTLGGTETILVVEDEAGVRHLLRRILTRHGYTVLMARDAEEALTIEGKYREMIDLLVTDMIMPGLNGAGLAQQIVARRPSMKVLFVSGYTSGQAIDVVSNRNARFLQKPFSGDALARSVRAQLDSDRQTNLTE